MFGAPEGGVGTQFEDELPSGKSFGEFTSMQILHSPTTVNRLVVGLHNFLVNPPRTGAKKILKQYRLGRILRRLTM